MKTISLNSLISELESPDFFARIALINNIDSFLLFVKSDQSIKDLINFISIDPDNLELVKKRIIKLLNFECDPEKLHPYDHSIAIYIFAFFEVSKGNIEEILEFIYKKKLKNLYWTYEIYNYILDNISYIDTSHCDTIQLSPFKKIKYIDINSF